MQLRGECNARLGIYETHAAGNRTWCQGRQRLQSVTGINHHKICPVPSGEKAGGVLSQGDTRQREVMYLLYADINVQFTYLPWGVPIFQGCGALGRGHFSDHALKWFINMTWFSADWSSDQRAGLLSKLHADQHVTQPCPSSLNTSRDLCGFTSPTSGSSEADLSSSPNKGKFQRWLSGRWLHHSFFQLILPLWSFG